MRDLGPQHALLQLFHQLRRRNFLLGPDDLLALHHTLSEGFGWASRNELRELCRTLWAKCRDEQLVLDSLFDQLVTEDWRLPAGPINAASPRTNEIRDPSERPAPADPSPAVRAPAGPDVVASPGHLPPVRVAERVLSTRPFILVPQHPVASRIVAQSWRRLRRPVRCGPATELDVKATIARRVEGGVVTPPVLRPRRRNTARVLLLVDRTGSMAPFDDFIAETCRAILQAAQFADSACFYFHDVPLEGASDVALAGLPRDSMFPTADSVLAQITPIRDGWLYRDPELLYPVPLAEVLRDHGRSWTVVVFSDAGAARQRYDVARVIDSLALAKTLHQAGATAVWMNPLPQSHWRSTSAAELARHVAMFPLDGEGIHRAISHLRGQPVAIERPV